MWGGLVDLIPSPFGVDRCVNGRFPAFRKHATREEELEEPAEASGQH